MLTEAKYIYIYMSKNLWRRNEFFNYLESLENDSLIHPSFPFHPFTSRPYFSLFIFRFEFFFYLFLPMQFLFLVFPPNIKIKKKKMLSKHLFHTAYTFCIVTVTVVQKLYTAKAFVTRTRSQKKEMQKEEEYESRLKGCQLKCHC